MNTPPPLAPLIHTILVLLRRHTDLHPGNIQVRIVDSHDRVVSSNLLSAAGPHPASATGDAHARKPGVSSSGAISSSSPGSGGSGGAAGSGRSRSKSSTLAAGGSGSSGEGLLNRGQHGTPAKGGGSGGGAGLRTQLVLLDFGLAEELTPEVRHRFISFINAIGACNADAAVRHLLAWNGARPQGCPDPAALRADMRSLFAHACDLSAPHGVDLDHVMKAVLALSRKHAVTIDSCYASLVIAVCVLVGFAASLDPQVNILDAAIPCLLFYSLSGRVSGRLYS